MADVLRILVVVAHPDDAEFGCAGSVARWVADGCEIHYCLFTSGNRGSDDPAMTPERLAAVREAEQRAYSGHRDHRHAGRLALDAVYPYARDRMHFPELLAEGFEPHKVRSVYLMGHDEPDVVIDITGTMGRKLEALRCHLSQLRDFAGTEGRVRDRAADLGKPHGYTYAEAFRGIDLPR